MNPKDVNKLNKKPYSPKMINKFCLKCQKFYFVSDYISKCPTCKASLQYCKQKDENIPKCPTCQSTNIKKLSDFTRTTHALAFGLFSKTARSQWVCNNCGNKW